MEEIWDNNKKYKIKVYFFKDNNMISQGVPFRDNRTLHGVLVIKCKETFIENTTNINQIPKGEIPTEICLDRDQLSLKSGKDKNRSQVQQWIENICYKNIIREVSYKITQPHALK